VLPPFGPSPPVEAWLERAATLLNRAVPTPARFVCRSLAQALLRSISGFLLQPAAQRREDKQPEPARGEVGACQTGAFCSADLPPPLRVSALCQARRAEHRRATPHQPPLGRSQRRQLGSRCAATWSGVKHVIPILASPARISDDGLTMPVKTLAA